MKQIDFENGKITDNILRASVPMLVAEVLSLNAAGVSDLGKGYGIGYQY